MRRKLEARGYGLKHDGRHFDKEGKPISYVDWVCLTETPDYKRVAWTELPGGGFISTVWLGLDHGFGCGRRIIFETMSGPDWERQERYSTIKDALEGHEQMVAEVLGERGKLS